MKKIVVLLLLTLFSGSINASNSLQPPIFLENVEFFSLALRLTGADDYQARGFNEHLQLADDFFREFRNHPSISGLKKLRDEHRLYFGDAMRMALSLKIENQRVLPDSLVFGRFFGDKLNLQVLLDVVALMDPFYRDSRFSEFFVSQQPYYYFAHHTFGDLLDAFDLDWYTSFFGPPAEENALMEFYPVLSFLILGNYGLGYTDAGGVRHNFAVISCYSQTEDGMPDFNPGHIETVVHEFNHSFCNPMMDLIYPQISGQVAPAFKYVEHKLRRQAYGSPLSMMYEILVRSAEVRYAMAQQASPENLAERISREEQRGFFWIADLVDLFDQYEANRELYPNLESFMPCIEEYHFSTAFAQRLQQAETQYQAYRQALLEQEQASAPLRPKVIYVSLPENEELVCPSTSQILLRFDRMMRTNSFGFNPANIEGAGYPEVKKIWWNEESKTELILEVELQPNTHYAFQLFLPAFQSLEGYAVRQQCLIDFKTGNSIKK